METKPPTIPNVVWQRPMKYPGIPNVFTYKNDLNTETRQKKDAAIQTLPLKGTNLKKIRSATDFFLENQARNRRVQCLNNFQNSHIYSQETNTDTTAKNIRLTIIFSTQKQIHKTAKISRKAETAKSSICHCFPLYFSRKTVCAPAFWKLSNIEQLSCLVAYRGPYPKLSRNFSSKRRDKCGNRHGSPY